MGVELERIDDLNRLESMRDQWLALAEAGGSGALFRGPHWLMPWWHAYHQILGATLSVYAGRVEGELVFLAPFYARLGRLGPGIKVREIRLMGDAGPRPPALDLLVAPGHAEQFGAALAAELASRSSEWDLLDLEPLQDPSRVRAHMANRLHAAGHRVLSTPAAGGARRIALAVAGIDVASEPGDALHRVYDHESGQLRKGLSLMRRLSRLEWAAREESSPLADPEASALLEEFTLQMGREGRARLARLDDSSDEAVATALVVDDGDRAVVLAMAVDPEHADRQVTERLIAAEARAAAERGRVALDVVTGAAEYALPPLPSSRQHALSLRAFSDSRGGAVARTYGAFRRQVDVAGAAAANARAAWAKIRHAAANVAQYDRLHLYRGELWTRGVKHAPGLTMEMFSEADFDALSERARAEMIESLELDPDYCRLKWQRGDLVVLARLDSRPAGIAWCARSSVEVPELGRHLRLGLHEAYIHDVFVAPQARGRNVAPSMLELLASELRQRDVYRCWALIDPANVASIRAFEKASYTAVCDIIYARMGTVDKVIVRPPDPGARKLLGLG